MPMPRCPRFPNGRKKEMLLSSLKESHVKVSTLETLSNCKKITNLKSWCSNLQKNFMKVLNIKMGDKQIKRQLRKFKLKNLKYRSLLIKNQLKEYLLQQVISNFLEGFASLNESCVKP